MNDRFSTNGNQATIAFDAKLPADCCRQQDRDDDRRRSSDVDALAAALVDVAQNGLQQVGKAVQ